ncbi:sigma factor-like helix-turn-helix DNA-binding protein, partial [Amycolatopsis tolypomycina]|uniref:sigma factor-like helix-turn-helix DNA-binding protein n=1 Tax=Amycolatopsis tolypomycina TaxID=208445 RepID=UPI003F4BBF15
LPRVQQEILTLRIAVGFSATETAEALGISPGSPASSRRRPTRRPRLPPRRRPSRRCR